jgi:hypothetical protein
MYPHCGQWPHPSTLNALLVSRNPQRGHGGTDEWGIGNYRPNSPSNCAWLHRDLPLVAQKFTWQALLFAAEARLVA